jgi:hypothetical protein
LISLCSFLLLSTLILINEQKYEFGMQDRWFLREICEQGIFDKHQVLGDGDEEAWK